MLEHTEEVIPVGYSCRTSWCETRRRLWFYLLFLRRDKRINASFNLIRNLCDTIFSRKSKNINPRGILKKVTKLILINTLVAEISFVNSRFLSNKWCKININRNQVKCLDWVLLLFDSIICDYNKWLSLYCNSVYNLFIIVLVYSSLP